ncbi:MAG: hypothetical protein PHW13_04615 [Methylococcales bacterium]|nr:hypothetical protein [Methylococcales bacterium]
MNEIFLKKNLSRLALYSMGVVWFILALYLAWHHAVWRDEVRALSFALQGDNIFAMFSGVQGEGHPVGWYVLLRAAHVMIANPEVLQIVAFIVGFASIVLLLRSSPLSLLFIFLFLFSRFALYEYTVMARNYGISMLVLFLLAANYPRHRDHGVLLGVLLFLLANCNVHSVVFVGAFLLFWFFDRFYNEKIDRQQFVRVYLINAGIALLGVFFCFIAVYPPANDAAQISRPEGMTLEMLANALFLPAGSFMILVPKLPIIDFTQESVKVITKYLMSLVMFGSMLGLIRRPAAVLAAFVSLIGLSLLFNVVYPGAYRHAALWLVFMTSLYWIAWQDGEVNQSFSAYAKPWIKNAGKVGYVLFLALLFFQDLKIKSLFSLQPESRSKDLGLLISQTPALREATVIADPDFLVEPVSYYVKNRTYLMRENRLGNTAVFTANARLKMSLDDILADAEKLRAQFGQPVVILLKHRLEDFANKPEDIKEGYNWRLSITPEQVKNFQAATRLIKRFEQASVNSSDESFDVYVYDGGVKPETQSAPQME